MPENRIYYSQFGRKPAQLSAVVPGLGQLYNKQYLKAASAISIFTFACGLTLFLAERATVGAWFTLPLLAVPPLTWGLSIYDAYQVGIERRRRDARRFKAEICTVVRGYDIDNNGFRRSHHDQERKPDWRLPYPDTNDEQWQSGLLRI